VTKRSLDEARQFGRSLQPTHDLQAEAGAADGQSTFAILDVNEVQADAQPKKITLQGVANVVAPLLPPASIAAAGSNTQIQFNDSGYLGGDAGLTFNKTTDALTAGSFIPSSSTVPTNGVYLPAANNVAISTNGQGRLFVDASGNVSLGSTTNFGSRRLSVNGIVSLQDGSDERSFWYWDGTITQIVTRGANPTTFWTNNAERARIRGDGMFEVKGAGGAGSTPAFSVSGTAPASCFSIDANGATKVNYTAVTGGLAAYVNSGGGLYSYHLGSGAGVINAVSDNSGTAGTLILSTGTEKVRLDASGRLLVGTSANTGGALLQVNGDRVRIATAKTPASATDTGSAGEICWDANYIYVCTATNTWKRTAIATW
jgi:hypothetical protein